MMQARSQNTNLMKQPMVVSLRRSVGAEALVYMIQRRRRQQGADSPIR